jgi:hypothetical protein
MLVLLAMLWCLPHFRLLTRRRFRPRFCVLLELLWRIQCLVFVENCHSLLCRTSYWVVLITEGLQG